MGLAEYFLGSGNPFAQWANSNRRTLGGIGAGLASGTNFGEGLALAARGAAAGREADDAYATQQKAEAQRVAEINQTAEWLKNNYPQFADLPPAQGFQLAAQLAGQKQGGSEYDQRYSAGQQFGLQGEDLNTFALTGSLPGVRNSNVTYGTTPVWGEYTDENGQKRQGYVVQGSDGSSKPADLPEGFAPTNPYELNAQKAAGSAFGKQTGGAQFDLPAAQLARDQTVAAVADIRKQSGGSAEQFGNILGVPQQMTPAWPGSQKADFRNSVSRASNLAFMQAREMLRGGGQITDFESKKAETAITNMQIAMETGSEKAFYEALDTFEQAVNDGFKKLQQQAGTMPGYGGATPSGGGNVTSGGISWSIEP